MDARPITPVMLQAWCDYQPPETAGSQTHRQIMIQRVAFFEGWIAAVEYAAAIAEKWRDENKAAAARARKRERLDGIGGYQAPEIAEQLDGAAIECNAIAEVIRALAQVDTHAKRGDANAAPSPMGSAVGSEADDAP